MRVRLDYEHTEKGQIPMKLNGNSRGSHSSGRSGHNYEYKPERREDAEPGAGEAYEASGSYAAESTPVSSGSGDGTPPGRNSRPPQGKRGSGGRKKRSKGRVIGAVIGAVVALVALAVIVYALWEKPPERPGGGLLRPTAESSAPESANPDATATPEPTEDPNAGAPATLNENMYTFLIVGFDQVAYHTDTIMVGRLDTLNHTINVVSIPRDTLMNISGGTKKINELFLRGMNNTDGDLDAKLQGGVDRMLEGITDILGFTPDVYAAVDLEAFVKLVDAIGGVDYDVPVDMHYSDPSQDLYINLDAGMQHLDGEQALAVMRFRSGYVTADIGRIGTQQDFLMSIASQFLSLGNIPKLGEFINIFTEYVITNMDTSNLAFFARQFLMCSSEDITFQTIPANYNDAIKGLSYVSIDIDGWLEVINECLNPYDQPVTEANVNILTHSINSGFYSTTGTIAGGADSFYDYTYLRG